MAIEINSDVVDTPPLPSATVMVLRDAADGPEVLMMRRHSLSNVLGGAHVFPGGKLDAADHLPDLAALDQPLVQLQARLGERDLDAATAAALHVAALRETFEECGLLLGQGATPAQLAQVQAQLRGGQPFAAALQQSGHRLATAALVPWSRWITPRVPSVTNKRFDTRFFVALAPPEQVALHDNHEATETVWLSPRAGLAQYWDNRIDLAPPQIMSLCQLARFGNVAELLAAAARRPPPLVAPEPFDEGGQRVICYPGDPRHSLPTPGWPGPTRLIYRNRRFEPEGGLDAFF